jgi:hypothetical protein
MNIRRITLWTLVLLAIIAGVVIGDATGLTPVHLVKTKPGVTLYF